MEVKERIVDVSGWLDGKVVTLVLTLAEGDEDGDGDDLDDGAPLVLEEE